MQPVEKHASTLSSAAGAAAWGALWSKGSWLRATGSPPSAGMPRSSWSRQAATHAFISRRPTFATSNPCAHFLETAREKFGYPYGLVNCAGIAVVGVLALLRDTDMDKAIATNLRGPLTLTKQVVRQMRGP